jgi:uncharacterized membrane protein (UPF0127 family)
VLVKSHYNEYLDDVGLLSQDRQYVYFLDGTKIKASQRLKLSPVVRVNARWMDKDIRLQCRTADTVSKKRLGLQGSAQLGWREAMYFPYANYTDVTFHQGSVPYSLDLLFLRDARIVAIQKETEVGSSAKWCCQQCDGVLEVNGGFCDASAAAVGDKILINAVSEVDLVELEEERSADELEQQLRAEAAIM